MFKTSGPFQVGRLGLKQKMLIPVHFRCFSIIFIISMVFFGFEKMLMCTLFELGGGLKKSILYICENVDILDDSLYVWIFYTWVIQLMRV